MAYSQKLNTYLYLSFVFLIRNQTQMDQSRGDQTRISTDTKLSPSFSTTSSMPMDLRPNQNQGEVFAFLLHSGTYSKYIVSSSLNSVVFVIMFISIGCREMIRHQIFFMCSSSKLTTLFLQWTFCAKTKRRRFR